MRDGGCEDEVYGPRGGDLVEGRDEEGMAGWIFWRRAGGRVGGVGVRGK